MNKIYTAYIEELIKDADNNTTLELRVRIPQVHGTAQSSGVPTQDLPIAKPLLIPGMIINKTKFENYLNLVTTVQVLVKDANFTRIYYLGFPIADSDIIQITDVEGGIF